MGIEVIHKNHLSTPHIPEKLNAVADKESPSNHVDAEWMLQSSFLESDIRTFMFQTRNRSILLPILIHSLANMQHLGQIIMANLSMVPSHA